LTRRLAVQESVRPDGLHAAGDVRRFRTAVPLLYETRDEIQRLQTEVEVQQTELAQLVEDMRAREERLKEALKPLNNRLDELVSNLSSLVVALRSDAEEQTLLNLARTRRDLIAAREEWQVLSSGGGAAERNAVEQEARTDRALLDQWRKGPGSKLDDLLEELGSLFPDLSLPAATNPELARAAAARSVSKELDRVTAVLAQDSLDINRAAALEQELNRALARAQILDNQLASLSADAGALAQTLAALVPHIHTEDCPVCGRDFREVSKKPLRARLSDRIAELTLSAGRLQVLSGEKSAAASAVANLGRERNQLQSRRISDETRNQLKAQRARLDELIRQLLDLTDEVNKGMELIARASASARKLDELRGRDSPANTLREILSTLARRLALTINLEQPVDATLHTLQSSLNEQEQRLMDQQTLRKSALSEAESLMSLHKKRAQLQITLGKNVARINRLVAAKEEADRRISLARDLARKARDVRTAITRRVFNDSLNMVWRDLFVRLAPDEPFVPAFALPLGSDRSVEAVLETVYRAGGKGGNPRAMLSAGNLNTAALTLFLALHLSVTKQLPWLVIDDPVQSMDEVHVSQFAALLRTLSKSQGRQIVLAMHERPLFDYLALELSPAYSNDRLITIELGQAADGQTTLTYEPLVWEPDKAIAA
jgi:exonuclease SbcC